MVGRLIEQEKVIRLKQQLHRGQPRAFTAREHLYLLVDIVSMEKECPQDITQPGTYIARGYPFNSFKDGHLIIKQFILVLSKIPDADFMSSLYNSLKINLSEYHPRQCCLSFAIAPHEGYFLTSFDL